MYNKNEMSVEELLEHITMLEKTIQVQHSTINRLLDTYVLGKTPGIYDKNTSNK